MRITYSNSCDWKEDWDGEGAPQIQPDLIGSVLHLVKQLMEELRPAPQDVYPLPDGNIMLEWQHQDGIIERIEIEGVGRGELMITYPNAPAEFFEMFWSPCDLSMSTAQMINSSPPTATDIR